MACTFNGYESAVGEIFRDNLRIRERSSGIIFAPNQQNGLSDTRQQVPQIFVYKFDERITHNRACVAVIRRASGFFVEFQQGRKGR